VVAAARLERAVAQVEQRADVPERVAEDHVGEPPRRHLGDDVAVVDDAAVQEGGGKGAREVGRADARRAERVERRGRRAALAEAQRGGERRERGAQAVSGVEDGDADAIERLAHLVPDRRELAPESLVHAAAALPGHGRAVEIGEPVAGAERAAEHEQREAGPAHERALRRAAVEEADLLEAGVAEEAAARFGVAAVDEARGLAHPERVRARVRAARERVERGQAGDLEEILRRARIDERLPRGGRLQAPSLSGFPSLAAILIRGREGKKSGISLHFVPRPSAPRTAAAATPRGLSAPPSRAPRSKAWSRSRRSRRGGTCGRSPPRRAPS